MNASWPKPQMIHVQSEKVAYSPTHIEAQYTYQSTNVQRRPDGSVVVEPCEHQMIIHTSVEIPRLGVMVVGVGGNNGTTLWGGIVANRERIQWRTRNGNVSANWYGSMFNCGTMKLGLDSATGHEVYVPFTSVLPFVKPEDIVLGGWDISHLNMGDAMRRAEVFDVQVQDQLYDHMKGTSPLRGIYRADFVASNQKQRADNVKSGTLQQQLEETRADIRKFKRENKCDKVIVLWSANTERFTDVTTGIHDTITNLMKAVKENHAEVSPSTVYCLASILEGCSFINGSPQNTFVPGVVQLAEQKGVFICGDDFKTGQTKVKSCLMHFFVSAGLKPVSIVSYNHLGNNDGVNLSSERQFRSKEISKSNVVDDMVDSNSILYENGEHPDHTVVIKNVPFVGDSKRAMDEYTSRIFMNGINTLVLYNTCEDSLLAAPLMVDLVMLTELSERISFRRKEAGGATEKLHSVLSILSYFLKAPMVPKNTPVINALFPQREAITNLLRACIGLPPNNYMMLECQLVPGNEGATENNYKTSHA